MRRGTKPGKAKVDAKSPVARKLPKNDASGRRDLEKRLAEALKREAEAQKREAEALEQQTATSDILRVISSSPTDVQPVFDAIAESSTRLLRGWSTIVWRCDGELLDVAAAYSGLPGSDEAVRAQFPMPVQRGTFIGDVVLDREVKQVEDAETHPWPVLRTLAKARGWRSNLAVPMLKDGRPIGVITVARAEPGPFSDIDIAMLQTLVDQAVRDV